MHIMAIDYGEKRVGIASTDETGSFALPRVVWSNDQALVGRVLQFISDHSITRVILGESRNLDGQANAIQMAIEIFKHNLEGRGVEVYLHPEVFTTLEARRLQGQSHMTDASAAALILKSYLDSRL
jgi:putative Holliday junction resolvase